MRGVGKPTASESIHPGQVVTVPLTAASQTGPPQPRNPGPEDPQAVDIPRYRVVVEVASHDRLEPLARLRHPFVHAGAELPFDFLQLRSHTFPDGLLPYGKVPVPGLPADMREPQKIERLRLAFSSPFPIWSGEPPELNPARFTW